MRLLSFCSWSWLAIACLLGLDSWFLGHSHIQGATYCMVVFLAHHVFLMDLRLSQTGKRGTRNGQ